MATEKLSPEQASRAREFEALFLTRLLSVGQRNLAASLDLSESAISNWKKDGIIERFCKALAILEIQLVPQSAVVTNVNYLRSLETLAALGIAAERKRPGPLGWD